MPEGDYTALLAEVKSLAEYIEQTRREVAALGADAAVKHHVLAATDELDAIVEHTAKATSIILDVCEGLDNVISPRHQGSIAMATARIYEACSFQDITGQRIEKVLRTLQAIESKLAEILRVFGGVALPKPPQDACQHHESALLNGPQQAGVAMDQSAVDALLDIKP